MVQAAGFEPAMLASRAADLQSAATSRIRLACVAEETGVEPAYARTADTYWFSRPAPNRRASLPWRRAENTIPKPEGSICLANSADDLIR